MTKLDNDVIRKKFGQYIRKARIDKKLRLSDVAAELDMTPEGYGYYEKGMREPSLATIISICNILDIELNDVIVYVLKSKASIKAKNSTPD